jgi:polyhydroxybutyrate depolymerase
MKMQLRIVFLIPCVLLATVLACGGTAATQTPPPAGQTDVLPPARDTEYTMIYAGVERSYVVHVPPGYDAARPVPLALAFHGITLDAYEMIRISGFNDQSDAEGFIVVYPNASGTQMSWNGGHCCGEAAANNVDDVGFVRAVFAEVSTSLNIDPKRIYATGFSNGAILVYRLACEMSDQIAAIGPVSATQAVEDLPNCQPARPVPVIHFHGTDDEPNPYNGGETAAGAHFISVADEMRFWTGIDGCPAQPQQSASGSILHDIYAPCESGAAVELYTIEGGLHAWPGGEAVNQRMGEPTMEISATALMWEFFLAHPKP